jgi:hypothetical protein
LLAAALHAEGGRRRAGKNQTAYMCADATAVSRVFAPPYPENYRVPKLGGQNAGLHRECRLIRLTRPAFFRDRQHPTIDDGDR